jgi:methanogenic corrinoid protein MtbC1
MDKKLVDLMADLMEDEVLALVKEKIKQGEDPMGILDDARSAMEAVGKRCESCEYFIPDLMMAGEILRQISDMVRPLLEKTTGPQKLGKVIIGTVAGDIHDIGKDIVTFMVDVSGYEVLDLGIDVPAEVFVEKAGLRDKIKIMIGGGQMDEEVRKYVKADAYGKDAVAGVELCRKWIGARQ